MLAHFFIRTYNHLVSQIEILRNISVVGKVLLVGCRFNPLLQELGDESWGTDPDPYVQQHKWEESDSPRQIMPYAVPDKRLNRRTYDWVVTDDIIPSLEPEALSAFLAGCDDLAPNVVHFVTPPVIVHATDHYWIDNDTLDVIPTVESEVI